MNHVNIYIWLYIYIYIIYLSIQLYITNREQFLLLSISHIEYMSIKRGAIMADAVIEKITNRE